MNKSERTKQSTPSTLLSSKDNLVCCATKEDSTTFYFQLQFPPSTAKQIQRSNNKVEKRRPKRWLEPRQTSPVAAENIDSIPTDQQTEVTMSPARSADAAGEVNNKVKGRSSTKELKNSPVSVKSFMDDAADDDSIICLEDTSEIDDHVYSSSAIVVVEEHPEDDNPTEERRRQNFPTRPCLTRSNSWSGRSNRILDNIHDVRGDGDDNNFLPRSLSFRIRKGCGGRNKKQELTTTSEHYLNGLSLLTTTISSPTSSSDSTNKASTTYKSLLLKKTHDTFGIVKGKFKLPSLPSSVKKKPSRETMLSGTLDASSALESLKSPGLLNSPYNKSSNNLNKDRQRLSMSEHVPRRAYSDSSSTRRYDSSQGSSNINSPLSDDNNKVVFTQKNGKVKIVRKKKDDDLSQSEHNPSSDWAIKQAWKQRKFRNKKDDALSQSEHTLPTTKSSTTKQSKYQSLNDSSSSWADLTLSLSPVGSIDKWENEVSTNLDMYVDIEREDTKKEMDDPEPKPDSEPNEPGRKNGNRNQEIQNGNPKEESSEANSLRKRSSSTKQETSPSPSRENRSSPRKSSSRTSRMRSWEEHLKNNRKRLLDSSKRQSSLRDLKSHRQNSLRDIKIQRQNSLRELNRSTGRGARSLSRSRGSNSKEELSSLDKRERLFDRSKRQSSLRDLKSPGSSCSLTRSYRRSNSNEELPSPQNTPRRQNSLRDLKSSGSRSYRRRNSKEELSSSSAVSPKKTLRLRRSSMDNPGGNEGKLNISSSREEQRRRGSMDTMINDSESNKALSFRREERRRSRKRRPGAATSSQLLHDP